MRNPQQRQPLIPLGQCLDCSVALLASWQRFPLVIYCIAGFTGLLIESDMSENGCGKWGVCAHFEPAETDGAERLRIMGVFYSPGKNHDWGRASSVCLLFF
uniref:Uncharacterized protein n=1 Tax=Eutreptiella gymnastica TaxID=73025 RepID=A0A7S1IBM3_9EUGL|mmetsp:Transcript_145214/g.253368  ORF Transcript_145214/g.253368 Transcript_145214/m.253368 type:complete len:101 (+) Transcript_145214:727-1029(+)